MQSFQVASEYCFILHHLSLYPLAGRIAKLRNVMRITKTVELRWGGSAKCTIFGLFHDLPQRFFQQRSGFFGRDALFTEGEDVLSGGLFDDQPVRTT